VPRQEQSGDHARAAPERPRAWAAALRLADACGRDRTTSGATSTPAVRPARQPAWTRRGRAV